MKTKFHKWLKKEGLTIEQFAVSVGMSSAAIRKHLNTGGSFRRASIAVIKAMYPDCPLVEGNNGNT